MNVLASIKVLTIYFVSVLLLSLAIIGLALSTILILLSSCVSVVIGLYLLSKLKRFENLYFLIVPFPLPKVLQSIVIFLLFFLTTVLMIALCYFSVGGIFQANALIDIIVLVGIAIISNVLAGMALALSVASIEKTLRGN